MSIDTSTDAVQALADQLNPEPGIYGDGDIASIVATLRALADERDKFKRATDKALSILGRDPAELAEERDRLVAERDKARADAARLREALKVAENGLCAVIAVMHFIPNAYGREGRALSVRKGLDAARAALTPPAQEPHCEGSQP